MFSYYGSKSKIVKKYPKPEYDHIVEPFAGSARYALEYWDRDVTLVDKYNVIIKIWEYLKRASAKDIESLPELERGDRIPDYLCEEEKYLLGFAVNRGSPHPKNVYTTWAARDKEITRHKKRILANLEKIRHWNFICGSYESLEITGGGLTLWTLLIRRWANFIHTRKLITAIWGSGAVR